MNTTTETATHAIKTLYAEIGLAETRKVIERYQAERPHKLTDEALRLLNDPAFIATLTAPLYAVEFPAFANDSACAAMAARSEGWEDTSWHNDACPSFTCDVFVLWIEHPDPAMREFNSARFTMVCEDETMLETEDWADVLAFMDDGKRDFS